MDKHEDFLKMEHHDRWLGFEREKVKEWFREAGLKNISVECVGENCCSKSGPSYKRGPLFLYELLS